MTKKKEEKVACLECKRLEEDLNDLRRDYFMFSTGFDCLVKNLAELKEMRIKLFRKITAVEKKMKKEEDRKTECFGCGGGCHE